MEASGHASAARVRPEGLTIALWFIAGMVVTSLVSRFTRSTQLRARGVRYEPVRVALAVPADERHHRDTGLEPGQTEGEPREDEQCRDDSQHVVGLLRKETSAPRGERLGVRGDVRRGRAR